jgi:hypothetical protein
LAKEFDMIVVTASQLNRASVEEVEFDHSHISGGISKINTADNVFGIFTTRSMRETGRYQLQLMKTRSSSGVGQKVELAFDIDSLRIVDAGEDEGYTPPPNSTVYDTLKKKSIVKSSDDADSESNLPKVKADVQSTKLKSMLAGLRSS